MLIFDQSRPGRRGVRPAAAPDHALSGLPANLRRAKPGPLPEASELQTVRHYTRLSQKNFSIDTHCYPLGSCTMKYNPRACHRLASLPGFLNRHPLASEKISQEAESSPEQVKGAPYHRPVRRLDEVRAARDMDLAWRPAS